LQCVVERAASCSTDAAPDTDAAGSQSSLIAWHDEVRARARGRRSHAPDKPSPLRRWAWFCAIVLHLVLVAGLRLALWPQHVARSDADVMQIDLVDLPLPEPALPEPAPLPAPTLTQPKHLLRASIPTAPASTPAIPAPAVAEPERPLRLFNADGSAALPDDIAAQLDRARPLPDFIPRKYEPSPLLAVKRPLKVRPNHFAQYWAGTDGMPLHEALMRHLIATKEFTTPWGGRYACAWILILVACGDVPDKPWNPPTTWKPATVLDEQ
jgi:hypothetical protein